MGFLPEQNKNSKLAPADYDRIREEGGNPADAFVGQFPEDSPQGINAKRLIDYVRQGHQIMKQMVNQSRPGEKRETDKLAKMIQELDLSNPNDIEFIMSLVLTTAVTIPPTSYGDDYTQWVDGEDK